MTLLFTKGLASNWWLHLLLNHISSSGSAFHFQKNGGISGSYRLTHHYGLVCFSVLKSACNTPGNSLQFVYNDIQMTVFITKACLLDTQCMQSNLLFGSECNSFMFSTKQMYTWDENAALVATETGILLRNKYYCGSLYKYISKELSSKTKTFLGFSPFIFTC